MNKFHGNNFCPRALERSSKDTHTHTHTQPPRDIGVDDRMPISLPWLSLQVIRPSLCVMSGWKDVPQSRDEVLMLRASGEQISSETLGILLWDNSSYKLSAPSWQNLTMVSRPESFGKPQAPNSGTRARLICEDSNSFSASSLLVPCSEPSEQNLGPVTPVWEAQNFKFFFFFLFFGKKRGGCSC